MITLRTKVKIKHNKIILFALVSFLFLFRFSAESNAQSYQEYFNQAQQAYHGGNYSKAIDLFNKAIEINPNSAEAYNALGLIYRNKGSSLSETSWFFKIATDIDPNMAEPHENLGKLYLQAQKMDLAEKHFLKAYELDKNLVSVQFSLAWLYVKGKPKPYEAIYFFEKVLEKKEIPNALFGLGLAYSMTDDKAMVLDSITKLKDKGFIDLAVQLENKIREPLVPEKVPQRMKPIQPQPAVVVGTKEPRLLPSPSPIMDGNMRVRLRGKMYGNSKGGPVQQNQQNHPGSLSK